MILGSLLALTVATGACSDSPTAPLTGPGGESLVVAQQSLVLPMGGHASLAGSVRDGQGNTISASQVTWESEDTTVVKVNGSGTVNAVGAGSTRVKVSRGGSKKEIQTTVYEAPTGDFVKYPTPEIAFIAGPQLTSGSSLNPWPFFDENAIKRGLELGADAASTDTYYDFALNQYVQFYRTGDPRFLEAARASADAWYTARKPQGSETAPRMAALSGIMLRAMDGRAEYWPWITSYVRTHYDIWIGLRLNNSALHYGVRDGSYALIYAAQLAAVHPDAGVRAEMKEKALAGGKQYYARLQRQDGGWYWDDPDDGKNYIFGQPFHIGLTLEALTLVHQLTGDAAVASAIAKGAEWLYQRGYRAQDPVKEKPGVMWRGMYYFVHPDGTAAGAVELAGGWDTNSIREVRQLSSTTVHAFGYAFKITKDARFQSMGDDVFSATFGKGRGPGADAYYNLCDYRAKEFNQSYRSAGRYLAWRLGQ